MNKNPTRGHNRSLIARELPLASFFFPLFFFFCPRRLFLSYEYEHTVLQHHGPLSNPISVA